MTSLTLAAGPSRTAMIPFRLRRGSFSTNLATPGQQILGAEAHHGVVLARARALGDRPVATRRLPGPRLVGAGHLPGGRTCGLAALIEQAAA